jgi:hypothetical protein
MSMKVYIGDPCHVLPRRVMDEFKGYWFTSRRFCDTTGLGHQYLYGEVSDSIRDEEGYTPTYTDEYGDECDVTERWCVDDYEDIPSHENLPEELEGVYDDTDKFFFSICSTWNGDGTFRDQHGNFYRNDMGCLGVVCVEPEIEKACQDCERAGLGKVWELPDSEDFGNPPTSWIQTIPRMVRDDNGTFTFGDNGEVVIQTGPDPDPEDEEEE